MPDPVAIDNWTLVQGEDFTRTYNLKNPDLSVKNLTGFTGICEFRTDKLDNGGRLILTPTFTLVDAANGVIRISGTDAETEAIKVKRLFFDIKITSGAGVSSRAVQGVISVSRQTTD